MKYFAYGSNMSIHRIQRRISNSKFIGVHTLKGYDLRFHKIGHDASAKCDAFHTKNDFDCIEGVVFDMNSNDVSRLDTIEGVGHGYEKADVSVVGADGEKIIAFMYVATNISESLLPYSWYKKHVLEGAKSAGLSPLYINKIEQVNSIKDPDEERDKAEVKIYE
ncbi:MAG: gamma-glutamylcyclotransferase [Alteromonadaceae bacterium]|nr:MAG: gamma-glutamylcyclotransferase [Alteromonadaceae bacterium]